MKQMGTTKDREYIVALSQGEAEALCILDRGMLFKDGGTGLVDFSGNDLSDKLFAVVHTFRSLRTLDATIKTLSDLRDQIQANPDPKAVSKAQD